MPTPIERVQTAANSIREFLDGTWTGQEGLHAIAESLDQAAMQLAALVESSRQKHRDAKSLHDEAERDREDSGCTDMDALERSAYNEAVMDVTSETMQAIGSSTT